MNNNQQHPVSPSDRDIEQWMNLPLSEEERLSVAFQAGADHELDACCEYLSLWVPKLPDGSQPEGLLRSARRPKPLTVSEEAKQALYQCANFCHYVNQLEYWNPIMKALERLSQYENQSMMSKPILLDRTNIINVT